MAQYYCTFMGTSYLNFISKNIFVYVPTKTVKV